MSFGEAINLLALLITAASVVYAAKQAKVAAEALAASRESTLASTILHFTTRYTDQFLTGEPLEKRIAEESFQNHFWAEYIVEFYFFDHGVVPKDIYTIWIVTLGRLYTGANGPLFRQSHRRFLQEFGKGYPRAVEFFEGVERVCEASPEKRDEELSRYVREWRPDASVFRRPSGSP